jgi:hypothetical protein
MPSDDPHDTSRGDEPSQTTLAPEVATPGSLSLGFKSWAAVTGQLHPSPDGRRADLELPGGAVVRVKPSPLRRAKFINRPILEGRYSVHLHLRTHGQGFLSREMELVALKPLAPDAPALEPEFELIGKVVRLDRVEGLVIVRVFPQRTDIEPFAVSAVASLEVLDSGEDAWSVKVDGIVRGSRLIARAISRVELIVPEHWRDWKTPQRRAAEEELKRHSIT